MSLLRSTLSLSLAIGIGGGGEEEIEQEGPRLHPIRPHVRTRCTQRLLQIGLSLAALPLHLATGVGRLSLPPSSLVLLLSLSFTLQLQRLLLLPPALLRPAVLREDALPCLLSLGVQSALLLLTLPLPLLLLLSFSLLLLSPPLLLLLLLLFLFLALPRAVVAVLVQEVQVFRLERDGATTRPVSLVLVLALVPVLVGGAPGVTPTPLPLPPLLLPLCASCLLLLS